MSPVAASLAQSESKKRFFDRLGLDERNKLHRHLYSAMKGEAVEGWTRLTGNREALTPQLKEDPTVEPPYTFGQIDEEAIHAQVMRIYKEARRDTRIMYQLGRDQDGDREENWIIRWLLWHVFRYRDDRNSNNARRRVADGEENEAGSDTISNSDIGSTTEAASGFTQHILPPGHNNQHVFAPGPSDQITLPLPPTTSPASTTSPEPTISTTATLSPAATLSPPTRYFDPVRDLFRS